MFTKLDFFIAFRYLKSKKSESFISVVSLFSLLGISLGVAALIVVMAVMNGFRIELTKKIVSFEGDIAVYSPSGQLGNYLEYAKKIKSIKEVNNIFPIVDKQGLISTDKKAPMGAKIQGIALEDLKNKHLIADNIIYGDIENFKDDFSVIIGRSLAYNLDVMVGSEIKLVSSEATSTFFGKIPKFKTFTVIGIFESGMSDYDAVAIFMPLSTAQKFYKLDNQVNLLEIHTNNPMTSNDTKFEIMHILDNTLEVNDWQNKNMPLFNALKTERVAMFMILTLIILVAAFNIISSLIMLVKDKTADIAILRTIGISRTSIIRIFLICGASLGISGTVIGVILGVSFAANIEAIKLFLESLTNVSLFNPLIYYLSELPSHIEPLDVLKIALLSLGLSLSATIYPAWRAATINPVESLR